MKLICERSPSSLDLTQFTSKLRSPSENHQVRVENKAFDIFSEMVKVKILEKSVQVCPLKSHMIEK